MARILIGTYSKDKAFLELNSSYFTSIEVLRNEVDNFCRTVPMFETTDDIKYVFLEDQPPSFKQQIKSVPTILVLDKNKKTRGLWNGGIALKLKITKQDVQDHIDKLIAQEAANLSRRRSTN